ncbi:MAG: DUF1150 domain-containing protein [Holosporales bacterium]|nr:DUF1150 domain-containing protein [Holosporales bacterium]
MKKGEFRVLLCPTETRKRTNIPVEYFSLDQIGAITPQELASLGVANVAYIKPIRLDKERNGFALYAADGTMIGFSASQDTALRAARRNHLIPQNLH